MSAAFFPVTTFTISMLLLTIIHWDRFDIRHFPFQLWLILYVVTPFLVPWVWWNNHHADPHEIQAGDVVTPVVVRIAMGAIGGFVLLVSLYSFVFPSWLIGVWVWNLVPLSARAMSGWLALLGVGGLVIARDRRWSSWRFSFESIVIWHVLVMIAAVLNPSDFTKGGLINWYTMTVTVLLALIVILYGVMESRRISVLPHSS